ncbi:MAG: hypothetical protein KQH59_18345 [Desulfobulbaceae bacterium]|nr:hypothetical protein [Desulfobulbaceae bacterium]
MREGELRKHAICSKCGNKIGHTGLPLFWTIRAERHGIKMDVVKRQTGLAMMLGGNALIAAAMGPDEDMTELVDSADLTLCEACASPVLELMASCGDGFEVVPLDQEYS